MFCCNKISYQHDLSPHSGTLQAASPSARQQRDAAAPNGGVGQRQDHGDSMKGWHHSGSQALFLLYRRHPTVYSLTTRCHSRHCQLKDFY
jgi:hypothetical protein